VQLRPPPCGSSPYTSTPTKSRGSLQPLIFASSESFVGRRYSAKQNSLPLQAPNPADAGSFLLDPNRSGNPSQSTDGKTKESCYNADARIQPISTSLWLPRLQSGLMCMGSARTMAGKLNGAWNGKESNDILALHSYRPKTALSLCHSTPFPIFQHAVLRGESRRTEMELESRFRPMAATEDSAKRNLLHPVRFRRQERWLAGCPLCVDRPA